MVTKIATLACISLFFATAVSPIPLKLGFTKAKTSSSELRASEYSVEMGTNWFPPPTRYEIEIEVGTPAKSFTVIIDTLTPHTTLVDASCTTCTASSLFNPADSSTYKKDKFFRIGNLTGILGSDIVALDADDSASVTGQSLFVLSKDTESIFDDQDGALGLGPGTPSHRSFIENLKAQGKIDRAIFAIFALHLYSNKVAYYPQIWIGGWDTDQYPEESAFAYVSVNTTGGSWAFDVTSVSFGKYSFPDAKAVIDTAEPKLIVPKDVYDRVTKIICPVLECSGDPHAITLSKNTHETLTGLSLNFALNGLQMSLPSQDLIFTNIKKNWKTHYLRLDWKVGVSEWRLGHGFLMNNYTLFDFEKGRVGFAARYDPEFGSWIKYLPWVILAVIIIVGIFLATYHKGESENQPEMEPLLPAARPQANS